MNTPRPGEEEAAVASSSPTATYTTEISTTRGGTTPWKSGLQLKLIAKQPSSAQTGLMELPELEVHLDGDDVTNWAATSVINNRLKVAVDMSAEAGVVCLNTVKYLICEALISHDAQRFTGSVASKCDDRSGTPAYNWNGTADRALAARLGTPQDPWPYLLAAASRSSTPSRHPGD